MNQGVKTLGRLTNGKGSNSMKACHDLGFGSFSVDIVTLSESEGVNVFKKYDSIILAHTGHDTKIGTILDKCLPSLNSHCGQVTIYSKEFTQILEIHRMFRADHEYINVLMTEVLMREHQVLENRTHPIMSPEILTFNGFIVTATKVLSQSTIKGSAVL